VFIECSLPPLPPSIAFFFVLEACRELIWKEANGVWDARVEAFVDDVSNDPLGTRLIEVVFLHGRGNVLFVLAMQKRDTIRLDR
jgi:hypothetical protein